MGRIVRLENSGGTVVTYDYDAAGRLIRATDETTGNTVEYAYDAAGSACAASAVARPLPGRKNHPAVREAFPMYLTMMPAASRRRRPSPIRAGGAVLAMTDREVSHADCHSVA